MVGAKLDWDRLKVFQTVADAGSINAAAKITGPSAMARYRRDLEELERALGHQLFDRSTKGLGLTTGRRRHPENCADHVGLPFSRSLTAQANAARTSSSSAPATGSRPTGWRVTFLSCSRLQPDVRIFFKVLPTTPNLVEGDCDIAIQFEPPSAANIVVASARMAALHSLRCAELPRADTASPKSCQTCRVTSV